MPEATQEALGTPEAGTTDAAPQPPPLPSSPSAAAAARTTAGGKTTEYVVFKSETREGPFTLVDTFITQGQTNAKREGAKTVGIEDAEKFFFTAVPTSSFRPEKPSITLQITFATEDDE